MKESFSKEVIVEEFVEGREVSVEAISFEGKHRILQITDKVTTGAPHFVELEHHQPSTLPLSVQNRIHRIVLDALNALHIRYGASHSELKITPDGHIKVIEIGARGGGDFIASHLVELSTGIDFMKAIIDVALGKFIFPSKKESRYSGVYFLSKETEYLFPIINDSAKYPEIIEAEITDTFLRRIKCSSDRSGYLIYQNNEKVQFR